MSEMQKHYLKGKLRTCVYYLTKITVFAEILFEKNIENQRSFILRLILFILGSGYNAMVNGKSLYGSQHLQKHNLKRKFRTCVFYTYTTFSPIFKIATFLILLHYS